MSSTYVTKPLSLTGLGLDINLTSTVQGYAYGLQPNRLPAVAGRGGVVGADRATVWGMGGEKETVSVSGNYMKAIAQTGQSDFSHSALSI